MLRRAFTMLELVIVILIMGIVASVGAEIIFNLYENYIKTRAVNRLQAQTELVLDIVAKRLQFRIKGSARAIVSKTNSLFVPLSNADANYTIIEWIGASNESFDNGGWSGFIDINSSDTNSTSKTIKTPGSDLNKANIIMKSLVSNVSLVKGEVGAPAIILKTQSSGSVGDYYTNVSGDLTVKVKKESKDIFKILNDDNVPNGEIIEQYWLSHSAFAIVPEGGINDFNLTLYYNYQPWLGESYLSNSTPKSVLVEHVSTFRFIQIGETVRVKLCIHDSKRSGSYDFSFCKERVIF